MKAEFYTSLNGCPIKIVLDGDRYRETISHSHRHEEGYSGYTETFTLDGDRVIREVESGGSDCDGRIGSEFTDYCLLTELKHRKVGNRKWPNWQELEKERVYDEFAQAAGY